MSRWSEQQLHEHELNAQFDRGYSLALYEQRRKEDLWRWWEHEHEEERPTFRLSDGTIIDGEETLKTA